jgi:hypothetical protein
MIPSLGAARVLVSAGTNPGGGQEEYRTTQRDKGELPRRLHGIIRLLRECIKGIAGYTDTQHGWRKANKKGLFVGWGGGVNHLFPPRLAVCIANGFI